MKLTVVEQTPEEKLLNKLRILEGKIQSADKNSVRLRWESGREMTNIREAHPEVVTAFVKPQTPGTYQEIVRRRYGEDPNG